MVGKKLKVSQTSYYKGASWENLHLPFNWVKLNYLMQLSLVSHILESIPSKINFLTPNDNQPNIGARDS